MQLTGSDTLAGTLRRCEFLLSEEKLSIDLAADLQREDLPEVTHGCRILRNVPMSEGRGGLRQTSTDLFERPGSRHVLVTCQSPFISKVTLFKN